MPKHLKEHSAVIVKTKFRLRKWNRFWKFVEIIILLLTLINTFVKDFLLKIGSWLHSLLGKTYLSDRSLPVFIRLIFLWCIKPPCTTKNFSCVEFTVCASLWFMYMKCGPMENSNGFTFMHCNTNVSIIILCPVYWWYNRGAILWYPYLIILINTNSSYWFTVISMRYSHYDHMFYNYLILQTCF